MVLWVPEEEINKDDGVDKIILKSGCDLTTCDLYFPILVKAASAIFHKFFIFSPTSNPLKIMKNIFRFI